MIILGHDVGSSNLGYSLYDTLTNTVLDYGEIINKQKCFEDKLVNIHNKFSKILNTYDVDVLVYEQPVFMNRGDTGEKLNRALGVVLVLCKLKKVDIFSYSPKRIKKEVTGDGNADKKKVMEYVSRYFGIDNKFKSNHASDSLACIQCYILDKLS